MVHGAMCSLTGVTVYARDHGAHRGQRDATDLAVAEAAGDVIIDHSYCLHVSIADG